jgi:hypothetical protein
MAHRLGDVEAAFDVAYDLLRGKRAGFEVEVACADAGVSCEAARGVAGRLHVELARGVGVHHVVFQDAAFDEHGAARGQTFTVEGTCAEAADVVEDQSAVVDDGDVFAGDSFAQHAAEERGVAVDGVAVGRVEDVADDGLRHLGGEDNRGLLGLDLTRAETLQRAACRFASDLFGVFEFRDGARV